MPVRPINTVIFDLDGTLIDSSADIIGSLRLAFELAGLKVPVILPLQIGPRLPELLQAINPKLTPGDKEKVIGHYRNIYDNIKSPQTSLIPGAMDVLQYLKRKEMLTFVATNKPASATLPLLIQFQIKSYFHDILTPTSLPGREINKTQMIQHILEFYKLDSRYTLMIGDHVDDIEAGKHNNVRTMAFAGGYSKADILARCNPDFTIEDLSEIINRI